MDSTWIRAEVAWFTDGPEPAMSLFADFHVFVMDLAAGLAAFSAPRLARIFLGLGKDEEAAEVVEDLRTVSIPPDGPAAWHSLSARLAARRGELEEALERIQQAEDIISATDMLPFQAETALDKAEVLLLAGRPDEARAAAEGALEMFKRKEHAPGAKRSREFLESL